MMEASMHGTFERPRETSDSDIPRKSGIGFLVLPTLVAVALVGLAIAKPAVSTWISEAAQAEFAAGFIVPDTAPTQVAGPAKEIRAVRAD
jgi:hypothetical protein